MQASSLRSSCHAPSPLTHSEGRFIAPATHSHVTPKRQQRPDPADVDQLAILEQKLRSQNDLLVQQQMLLQQLQLQQYSSHYATPPYTPQSANSQFAKVRQGLNTRSPVNNMFYDPATGQYYVLGPQQNTMQQHYMMTPPSAKQQEPLPGIVEHLARPTASRSQTPPKEGLPSRQPRGPPSLDLLATDHEGLINFGSRTRRRAAKILEAGLLRRRNSPAPEVQRPSSRASFRSEGSHGSLGPIDEAFPAIHIS